MIRVLQVYCEFNPQYSGVARHMDGLSRALATRHGVRVEILAPQVGEIPGQPPYTITAGGWGNLLSAVRRADVIHAHGARTGLAAAAVHLAAALGKPAVFTPHCYYDGGSAMRRRAKALWDATVERSVFRRAQAIIVLHDGWKADLIRRGFIGRNCVVLANCVDADAVNERLSAGAARRLEGNPAVLSIGRLDPVKRLDDVIAALKLAGMGQAVLHVVGTGQDGPRLRGLADQYGIADRVRFHGWLDDCQSAAMMRGCDVMVLASEREGMPTIVLEALLAGIPIVHSDIEGCMSIAHAVDWDGAYPLGDVAALAARLTQVAGMPVPQAVSRAVHDKFSWQGRIGELYGLYTSLLA